MNVWDSNLEPQPAPPASRIVMAHIFKGGRHRCLRPPTEPLSWFKHSVICLACCQHKSCQLLLVIKNSCVRIGVLTKYFLVWSYLWQVLNILSNRYISEVYPTLPTTVVVRITPSKHTVVILSVMSNVGVWVRQLIGNLINVMILLLYCGQKARIRQKIWEITY